MSLTRRAFVHGAVGCLGAAALTAAAGAPPRDGAPAPVRAVLFDAFAVFDPRPVAALAEAEFPGRGAELTALWRTRQFEYAWLRSVMRDYADFWRCTDDALRFAAASLRLDLGGGRGDRLMRAYLALPPWPDAPPALRALRAAGVRLGLLSNFTPAMLDAAVRGGGLGGVFEHVLSTDRARTFKPDPAAYRLGLDALGAPRGEVVFAAFAGWDAAGARRFGYPTFWVNRLQAPPEALGAPPSEGAGPTLAELVAFVEGRR